MSTLPADDGVLRASGKRYRRPFNPSDWASSILTIRHNVLCLGMSYPCVDTVLANCKGKGRRKEQKIFHSAPSVERSVELVRRKLLNQIDGRDLARVVALEANNDILAYTVSKEEGAYYDQRHLHADFNSRTLVQQMHWRWGKTVRFRQVILDYFWSPSGSWAIKHWQRYFFNENIPRLVTENLFNFGDLENDSVFVSAKEANTTEDYISSTAAVVYLPFCSHCLSQVVACSEKLSQYYTISFLRKDQLDEHTLWKATNTISPESMAGWLAKSINQEDFYCTLHARQIKNGTIDADVTKEDILDVFNRIDRSHEVRMIKLTALRKFHPDYPKSNLHRARPTLGLNIGGYVGLLSRRSISPKNIDNATLINTNEPPPRKRVEPMKPPRAMPRKRSLSHQRLNELTGSKRAKRRKSRPSMVATSGAGMEEESNMWDSFWDRIDTSRESEYVKAIPSSDPNTTPIPMKSPPKGTKAIEEVEYAGQPSPDKGLALHWTPTGRELSEKSNDPIEESDAPWGDLEWALFEEKHRWSTKNELRLEMGIVGHSGHGGQLLQEGFSGQIPLEVINGSSAFDAAQYPRGEQSDTTLPVSLGTEPSPSAMLNVGRGQPMKSAQDDNTRGMATEADPLQNNGATPDVNDVLMEPNHHSHPGNKQFFGALSQCTHDSLEVSGCFVDALKSLDPPGRFLQQESSGIWDIMDYDVAIRVAHHVQNDIFVSQSNDDPDNERVASFLSAVQQFVDAKSSRTHSQNNAEGRPVAGYASHALTGRESTEASGGTDEPTGSLTTFPTSSSKSTSTATCGGHASKESDETNMRRPKHNTAAKRARKGRSLAVARALV